MTTPAPPAGWYPDPVGTFDQRWWDGAAWADRVMTSGAVGVSPMSASDSERQSVAAGLRDAASAQTPPPPTPAPAPAPPPPPAQAVPPQQPAAPSGFSAASPSRSAPAATTNWPMWAFIGLPMGAFLFTLLFGGTVGATVLWFIVSFAATIGLVLADLNANPQMERETAKPGWLGSALLLPPLYVWLRQRDLGLPKWPTAAWIGSFVVAVGLIVVTGSGNVLDNALLESGMEDWAQDSYGVTVTANCPADQPSRTGHRFVCELRADGERISVRVEVLNNAGDVEWEIVG